MKGFIRIWPFPVGNATEYDIDTCIYCKFSVKYKHFFSKDNFDGTLGKCTPFLYKFFRFASAKRDGSNYFVLLIITDGVITDMPQTIMSIVNVSCFFFFFF